MKEREILELEVLEFYGNKYYFEKGEWKLNGRNYTVALRGQVDQEYNYFYFRRSFYRTYDQLIEDLREDNGYGDSYKIFECTFDWDNEIKTKKEVGIFLNFIDVKEFLKKQNEIEKYYIHRGTYHAHMKKYEYEKEALEFFIV